MYLDQSGVLRCFQGPGGERSRRSHSVAHVSALCAGGVAGVSGVGGMGGVSGVGGGVSGAAGGGTSEYVRNQLRAVVGARPARPDMHTLHAPDLDPLLNFDMSAPGQ